MLNVRVSWSEAPAASDRVEPCVIGPLLSLTVSHDGRAAVSVQLTTPKPELLTESCCDAGLTPGAVVTLTAGGRACLPRPPPRREKFVWMRTRERHVHPTAAAPAGPPTTPDPLC